MRLVLIAGTGRSVNFPAVAFFIAQLSSTGDSHLAKRVEWIIRIDRIDPDDFAQKESSARQ